MSAPEFEEIRQILRENAIAMQELRKSQEETDRRFKETDRKFQETDRKFQETEKLVRDMSRQIGGIDTNIGLGAEAYFQTALDKTLSFAGIQFDDMFSNLKKSRHGKNCEFDIVLVNHGAVAIIDAKHRIHKKQAEELATRKLKTFREFFPEYKDYQVYLGLAGFSLEDEVEDEARAYGVGLLKQDGNAVKTVDIPLKTY